MHDKFLILVIGLKKNQIFSLFPIVKMNANRLGNLEADFQQVLLIQFFENFHNIVVKHQ